jgi:hypothetical protein
MDLYDDASDYGDYDGMQDEDDVDDEDLNEEEGKVTPVSSRSSC